MTGYVYAIRGGGLVKIGYSRCPLLRLSKINSDNAFDCELVGAVAATREQEAELHGLLSPWRSSGEWFHETGPVVAFMNMLPRVERPKRIPRSTRRVATTALQKAVDVAGGTSGLAKAIGVRPQAVSQWKLCPPARAVAVERATGISRHKLRPDFFGLEENAA